MGRFLVNPSHAERLRRLGLTAPERVLDLPGLLVNGHPGRNVARVELPAPAGDGPAPAAYLKRDYRVRRRDRLANLAAGFGPVSGPVREAQQLQALARAGLPAPEWLAAGEDDAGRAFLLVAEEPGAVDLRRYLAGDASPGSPARRRLARALGETLGRLHAAGFGHPELSAKHVLVRPDGHLCFLDWERSRAPGPSGPRPGDLALLSATVADALASPRDRARCLRHYLTALGIDAPPTARRTLLRRLCRLTLALRRRPRVRREGGLPPPHTAEGVRWLDGEALCVTESFWADLGRRRPDWLTRLAAGDRDTPPAGEVVPLGGGRLGRLHRSTASRPLAWLWARLRGRQPQADEVRRAGQLFREQKHGRAGVRLLAFGQRRPRPWRVCAFLLTEIAEPLAERRV